MTGAPRVCPITYLGSPVRLQDTTVHRSSTAPTHHQTPQGRGKILNGESSRHPLLLNRELNTTHRGVEEKGKGPENLRDTATSDPRTHTDVTSWRPRQRSTSDVQKSRSDLGRDDHDTTRPSD